MADRGQSSPLLVHTRLQLEDCCLLSMSEVKDKDVVTESRAGLAPRTCFCVGMFYTPRVRGLIRGRERTNIATFPCSFRRHEHCLQSFCPFFSSYFFSSWSHEYMLDAVSEF